MKNKLYKFTALFASIAVTGVISLIYLTHVSAAPSGFYLSPSATSVQSGQDFTVQVRINPSTAVDAVQARVTYDTSKLEFRSAAMGSTFNKITDPSGGGGSVSVNGATPGFACSVGSDSLVATITFRASVGSGSTAINYAPVGSGPSDTNADCGGTLINPGITGVTISFTTPTCPAGQTGTPPNCTTPSSGGSSTGSTGSTGSTSGGSTSGSTKPSTGTTGSTGSTGSTGGTAPAPGTTTPPPPAAPTVNQTVENQFTQATIKIESDKPVVAVVQFGTTDQLGQVTPPSELSKSPKIEIDPALLTPGTTYYYKTVATDADGNKTESKVLTFTTKGYTLRLAVLDKNFHPLRNKTVTLHSTPRQAKTDSNGYVTFSNVAPGSHQIEYGSGKNKTTKGLLVDNNVFTDKSGKQSAAPQDVAVILDIKQSALPTWLFVTLPLLIIVMTAGVISLSGNNGGSAVAKLKSKFAKAPTAVTEPAPAAKPTIESVKGPEPLKPGGVISPASKEHHE